MKGSNRYATSVVGARGFGVQTGNNLGFQVVAMPFLADAHRRCALYVMLVMTQCTELLPVRVIAFGILTSRPIHARHPLYPCWSQWMRTMSRIEIWLRHCVSGMLRDDNK